jgi:death-on-curing protein
MSRPIFLTVEEALKIHAYQVETFGGDPGVLNMGLLESALAQPQMTWQYTAADLATLAATYLFHLAMNHPFADGNKRTAAHAAIVFLGMNGIDVDYPIDEAERITVAVASGAAEKADAIRFFQALLEQAE